MSSLQFDGHTWTDRGDGLYLPDVEYTVSGETFLGIGSDCEGKTFLLKETTTQGVYIMVAMSCNRDSWDAMWSKQDEINNNGGTAFTMAGWDPGVIGGLTYVV